MNEPQKVTNSRRLVAVHELAMVLGVKDSWIYDRTRQGQEAIPFIRLGAYVRFDTDEVISFFKTHGDKSIINHRNAETTTQHGFINNARSGEQIQTFNGLHSVSPNQQDHQGETGAPETKEHGLADR